MPTKRQLCTSCHSCPLSHLHSLHLYMRRGLTARCRRLLTMKPILPAVAIIAFVPACFFLANKDGYIEHVSRLAHGELVNVSASENASIDAFVEEVTLIKEEPRRFCTQEERKKSMQRFCDAHPHLKTDYSKHPMSELHRFHIFLVDEQHKILFCAVPKAAVTLWRTMFLLGTGKINPEKEKLKPYHGPYLNRMGLKFLYNYTEPEQKDILKNYYKVMNMRHPVERSLSSYMDKFVFSEIEFPILEAIDYINKQYRPQTNQIRLPKGRQTIPSGVKFPEFVDMVLDSEAPYNIHWDSVINICHPCIIDYDYIMKTETMDNDADVILEKLSSNLDEPLKLKKIHSHRDATPQDAEEPNHFRKMLPELRNISKDHMERFVDVYKHDMEMFGYNFNKDSAEIDCGLRDLCC